MGIAKGIVNNEQELRTALNIRGELIQLDFSWGEVAAAETADWLNQGWVRFMLFVAMMVLAVVEFTHPGSSIPGIAAVVCLVLLVGAPFLTGLAQAWEIVLIVLGVAIIAADLFFFGGIGFLAIPGFVLMAIGLIASFVPMEPGRFIPTLPGTADAVWRGLAVVVFGSLAALGVFAFLSRYLYTTPGFKHLQLAPSGTGTDAPNIKDAADRPANEAVFIGAMGRATTDLRPAGKVRFDDHLVDVVSYGSFIPQGTEIEVVSVEGYRVVVRPRRHPQDAVPPAPPVAPPGGSA
jgi:membrane-bound serine protease (ClpP class)